MMTESDRRVKELSELLNRSDKLIITGTIESLRQQTPFKGAIGLLVALYDRTDDSEIKKAVAGFLNDIKDQSVCEEVVSEIRRNRKSDTVSMLVSSCWQSGLNYSDYSVDMAKVFLESDYVTAIECMTVIEDTVDRMSKKKKEEVIRLIEDSDIPQPGEKGILLLELISILER